MMFDFFSMIGNHADREVKRYEKGDLFIDTCQVTDAKHPYETAIGHPAFNSGKLVIVEEYDSFVAAKKGHDLWVKKMTADTLPTELQDVSSCGLKRIYKALGGE